ncbi:hypothetical protein M513_00450 [Trichuris suis]|nr:hypothetical protein M513_00450 [Trichuris suis]
MFRQRTINSFGSLPTNSTHRFNSSHLTTGKVQSSGNPLGNVLWPQLNPFGSYIDERTLNFLGFTLSSEKEL